MNRVLIRAFHTRRRPNICDTQSKVGDEGRKGRSDPERTTLSTKKSLQLEIGPLIRLPSHFSPFRNRETEHGQDFKVRTSASPGNMLDSPWVMGRLHARNIFGNESQAARKAIFWPLFSLFSLFSEVLVFPLCLPWSCFIENAGCGGRNIIRKMTRVFVKSLKSLRTRFPGLESFFRSLSTVYS